MPSVEEPVFTPEWRRAHAELADAYLRNLDQQVATLAGLPADTVAALALVAQAHYMAATLKG